MPANNPYAAPQSAPADEHRLPGDELTIAKGLLIVVACSVGFAAVGAALGAALGYFAPEYYRGVFSGGRNAGFDPFQVGLGLGLTQGAIGGLLVGAVVVLAVAFVQRRRTA